MQEPDDTETALQRFLKKSHKLEQDLQAQLYFALHGQPNASQKPLFQFLTRSMSAQ